MNIDNKSPNKLLEAGYILALQNIKDNKWADACELLSQILAVDPQYKDANAYLRYAEGRQAFEQSDWNTAVEKLEEIHTFENVQAFLDQAKRKREAVSLYEEALEHLDKFQWKQAQEKLGRALRQDPDHLKAASKLDEAERHAASKQRFDLGREYIDQEKWQKAIDILQEIINSNPAYPQLAEVNDRLQEAKKQQYLKQLKEEGLACLHRKDWAGAVSKFTLLLHDAQDYPGGRAWLEDAEREYQRNREEPEHPSAGGLFSLWWQERSDFAKGVFVAIAVATIGSTVAGCFTIGAALIQVFGPTAFHGSGGPVITETYTPTTTLVYTFMPNPPPSATVLPTKTPTLTSAAKPPLIDTPTSIPYPTPVLVSPDEGTSFSAGEEVKLVWEWGQDLVENELFEPRIRLKGEQKFDPMDSTKVSYHFVPASELTQAGTYEWQVAIVSRSGEEKGLSKIWSFEVRKP